MESSRISIRNLSVVFPDHVALKNVSFDIPDRCITAIIGPSGCGKTTLLKSLNHLLDLHEKAQIEGEVLLDGQNIYAPDIDVTLIRKRVGLLAQRPYPLPMSIYDNVAYGPTLHGLVKSRRERDECVEKYLKLAGLWDEVNHRLSSPAATLSLGQQQRLCLARGLAIEPEVLLCDESTSALDPISARHIEDRLLALKDRYTVVMVTHILRQARRLADYVAFLWLGELIEVGPAESVWEDPREALTRAYFRGE